MTKPLLFSDHFITIETLYTVQVALSVRFRFGMVYVQLKRHLINDCIPGSKRYKWKHCAFYPFTLFIFSFLALYTYFSTLINLTSLMATISKRDLFSPPTKILILLLITQVHRERLFFPLSLFENCNLINVIVIWEIFFNATYFFL